MVMFKIKLCSSRAIRAAACVCIASAALVASACQQKDSAAKDGGIAYKILTDEAYQPFSWKDGDGRLHGLDVELFCAVADASGINFTLDAANFSEAMHKLQKGEVDGVIASVNSTKRRRNLYDFSDSYFSSKSVVLASYKTGQISNMSDLEGKSMAYKKSTLSEMWADIHKKHLSGSQGFDSFTETLLNVEHGSFDFTIADAPLAQYYLGTGMYSNVHVVMDNIFDNAENNEYYFVVRKGEDQELIRLFNEGLKQIRKSGEYSRIVKKYMRDLHD